MKLFTFLVLLCLITSPAAYAKKYTKTRALAEQGSAIHQWKLGYSYEKGAKRIRRNPGTAAQWYRKAAVQGFREAQFSLGNLYDKGNGVELDHTKALKWYHSAAEQNHVKAQFILGLKYGLGQNVSQDNTEAAKWYLKAAEQGYAPAQYNLGIMHAGGIGIAQNLTEAFIWTSLAAQSGHGRAIQTNDMLMTKLTPEALDIAQQKTSNLSAEIELRKAPPTNNK